METYAELVLLLFYPYRESCDLRIRDSFVDKLKEAYQKNRIPQSAQTFLQNLLDAKSNSLRNCSRYRDDLQRNTKQYQCMSSECDTKENKKIEDDELIMGDNLDAFLQAWDEELLSSLDSESNNPDEENHVPESCKIKDMKDNFYKLNYN